MPNSPRLRRWAILLSEYDFEIVYTKGQFHEDVDCLSRAPIGNGSDEYLERRICTIVMHANQFQWIKGHDDPESKEILQQAREKKNDLRLSNDMVYNGVRLYLPPVRRQATIEEAHLATCRGSIRTTSERLNTVWWRGIDDDIKNYVNACKICQTQRVERAKPTGDMFHHEVYEPG